MENGGNTGGDRRISSINRMFIKVGEMLWFVSSYFCGIRLDKLFKAKRLALDFCCEGFSFFLV